MVAQLPSIGLVVCATTFPGCSRAGLQISKPIQTTNGYLRGCVENPESWPQTRRSSCLTGTHKRSADKVVNKLGAHFGVRCCSKENPKETRCSSKEGRTSVSSEVHFSRGTLPKKKVKGTNGHPGLINPWLINRGCPCFSGESSLLEVSTPY